MGRDSGRTVEPRGGMQLVPVYTGIRCAVVDDYMNKNPKIQYVHPKEIRAKGFVDFVMN
jgi:hypothetical protein